MANVSTKVPRLHRATWLGQAGESGETARAPRPRVIVHRWLEDGPQGRAGEVSVRAVRGDGRRPSSFEVFSAVTYQDPSDEQLGYAVERAEGYLR